MTAGWSGARSGSRTRPRFCRSSAGIASGLEQNLAEDRAIPEEPLGLGRLVERQGPVDDRHHPAGPGELHQLDQSFDGPTVRASNLVLVGPEVSGVGGE